MDTKFGKAWYNRKSKKEAMSMSKQYTQRDEEFKKMIVNKIKESGEKNE